MKSNSRWKNHDVWLCLNHLPAVRYRAGQIQCWYAGCHTTRPDMATQPEQTEEPKPAPAPRPRPRPRRPARPVAAAAQPVAVAAAPLAPSASVEAPRSEPASSGEVIPGDEEDVTEAVVDFDPELKCAWPPCVKRQRPRSKYCSRNCSNKFARWRHRQRQKATE